MLKFLLAFTATFFSIVEFSPSFCMWHNQLKDENAVSSHLPAFSLRALSAPHAVNVDFIFDLQGHRKALQDAFENAKERVIVVSPFITENAINADNLPGLIIKTLRRGVAVTLYTDTREIKKALYLSKILNTFHQRQVDWRIVDNLHAKMIIIDNIGIINGSFNWLSASRDPESIYANFEVSTSLTGSGVQYGIGKSLYHLQEMENKALKSNFLRAINLYKLGSSFKENKESSLETISMLGIKQDDTNIVLNYRMVRPLLRGILLYAQELGENHFWAWAAALSQAFEEPEGDLIAWAMTEKEKGDLLYLDYKRSIRTHSKNTIF